MAASYEWTEWHLTPEGWVRGSNRVDINVVTEVPLPRNRVATFRYSEKMTSPFSDADKYVDEIWMSDQKEVVEGLKKQFGDCPLSL